MATEVTEKTTPLKAELTKQTADVEATRKLYNDAADDKKAEEAQKTISKLSDVNKVLDELEPKVVEAENLAIKAKNNKTAYDATKKAVTDSSIDGKLDAAEDYITENTTGDGQMFYLQELAKLRNSLDDLNAAIDKSYGDKKSARLIASK